MNSTTRLLSGLLATRLLVAAASAQTPVLRGQAVDAATGHPLPYASVGVLHRPAGTVANGEGNFVLAVPGQFDADSLRVSLVGYQSYTATVAQFRQRLCGAERACPVALKASTELAEVVVRPRGRAVRRVLGNTVATPGVAQRFADNVLGNQVGQRIRSQYPAMLEQVSFKISSCTYDSLFYRLNVYPLGPDGRPDERRNLLPEAVYVRVAKAQTATRICMDLSRYQLWLAPRQEVAVCLELVRNLGPGKLWFAATFPYGGPVFEKDAGVGGEWSREGAFGAALSVLVTQIRP